jgi:hypothetical protein
VIRGLENLDVTRSSQPRETHSKLAIVITDEVFRTLCWLPLTSVLKRDRFRPRISPVRSVFSRLLPRVSQLAGRVWLSRSRRLFHLFPRCVLSSPAMLTVCRRGRIPCLHHVTPGVLLPQLPWL